MEITATAVAGIAGVVVAIGAIVAAAANMMNPNRVPMFETPGQGPVQTQYTPQHPVYAQPMYQMPVYQQPVYQQPVYQQPVYQQPIPQPVQVRQSVQPVAPYLSEYPWGYSAYLYYLANMPLTNEQPNPIYSYPYQQQMSSGQEFKYDWDKFNKKRMAEAAMSQTMGAPPGQQYQSCQTPPYPWGSQQPMQQTIDLTQIPAYNRSYGNGSTSFCQIPSCYAYDGTWRGF